MSKPDSRQKDQWAIHFSSSQCLLDQFKRIIAHNRDEQYRQFQLNSSSVNLLIQQRSLLMDDLLKLSWHHFFPDCPANLALIAVGGYGREELLPYSDIDLLILANESAIEAHRQQLEAYITFLWDTNLEIGHSVRSCNDCIVQARNDLSIATNLLESRYICGDNDLYDTLFIAISSDEVLSSEDFFSAKIAEQKARHRKLGETKFNLEPNVKNSPGGLRDIQTIGWITKRHFDNHPFKELVQDGFLSQKDLDILTKGQTFLFKIRFALHMINHRKEDRFLFEYQRQIAILLGYIDNKNALAIEQMMKRYYRWVLALSELNEMLLQLFDETILHNHHNEPTKTLNSRFCIRNTLIEATDSSTFREEPSALLEIFLLISQNPDITGVRASTIRQIRDNRHRINHYFRQNSRNRGLFLSILQAPCRVADTIDLMLRYGILGKFIPAFGKIIGQTQLDLFHIYTVDAHTIRVLKNMANFTDDLDNAFPLPAKVIKTIKKKELLYLACIFHDIAKGRGGDHSMLGSTEAYDFCQSLGLGKADSKLVSWLVKYHLYMSHTAQKKDLSDPEVIKQFATRLGDQRHLDFLFLLTVADINGTNQTLWNSWRAVLLYQLYEETRRLLRSGLETTVDKQDIINETQENALQQLLDLNLDKAAITALWEQAGDDYFLRETADDIVWHTQTILDQPATGKPLVFIRNSSSHQQYESASQLFIYTPDKLHTFAKVTAFLEQQSLSIVGARIYSSLSGFTLDTFLVIDAEGKPLSLDNGLDFAISRDLGLLLEGAPSMDISTERRTPRQLKFFAFPTETHFYTDIDKGFSILEVITADRPGLLAVIGELFIELNIVLTGAKIATLGEKVEDIFYITDHSGHPILDKTMAITIQDQLCKRLDQEVAKTS